MSRNRSHRRRRRFGRRFGDDSDWGGFGSPGNLWFADTQIVST